MNFYYKKSLGQHFLRDKNIAQKFAQTIKEKQKFIIEIGSGNAAITKFLTEKGENLILIEKDEKLWEKLKKIFSDKKNISFLNEDACSTELKNFLPEGCKATIIGNLPFNSAIKILFNFIKQLEFINKMIFSFQKEVAERLLAREGSKKYGIPTILTNLYLNTHKLFDIPQCAFYPQPEVMTSVLLFLPRESPSFPIEDIELFKKILKASFQRRRKTIFNSLKGSGVFDEKLILNILQEVGIQPSLRAEEISIEKYFLLYKFFKKNKLPW